MKKLSEVSQYSLEKYLGETATYGERAFSVIRIFAVALGTVEMFSFRSAFQYLLEGSPKYLSFACGFLASILFSLGTLLLLRPQRVSIAFRLLSVFFDAAFVSAIIAPSTIWPSETYHGVLARPDVALYFVIVIASGFRLSKPVIAFSAALNFLCCATLVSIDFTVNRHDLVYTMREVFSCALLLTMSTLVGFAIRSRIITISSEGMKAMTESENVRKSFGAYISPELVAAALSADVMGRAGEKQSVAVLFADLVGFTSYAEKIPPDRLVKELNDYLEIMIKAAKEEHGVVDKFIGDSIMVVFGIPTPHEDDTFRALRCAMKMEIALKEHNVERRSRGLEEFRHGIGIHFGEVVAGNIGTAERLQYTVIGDTVNMASRLEAATRELGCQVLISKAAIEAIGDKIGDFDLKSFGVIKLRGREESSEVFSFA